MQVAPTISAASRYRATALGLLILVPVAAVRAQGDTEVLSNATIVQMVAGRLSRDLIINKINAARPGFDISSDGIIYLCSNKVDQKIVALMLQVAEGARKRGNPPSALVGLDEVLSNESVVHMVTAKVPKQLILAKVQMSRSAFDVSASGLVSLNTSKVPEEVIKAMMLPPPAPVSPTPIPVREPAPAPPPATTTAAAPKTPPKAPAKKPPPPPPPPPAKKPPEFGSGR